MSSPTKRQRRSRIACEPCRDRKRKCDGHQPCETCREFEYNCYYDVNARKKRNKKPVRPAQTQQQELPVDDTTTTPPVLESNSGAAFVRNLGLKIDPANAPEPQLFAWNIGARQLPGNFAALPVVDIISQGEMKALAQIYFEKVDPYYGFIDCETCFASLNSRWLRSSTPEPYDVVLCGVAALAYVFSRRKAVAAELHLVESARSALEQYSISGIPSFTIVSGWTLRLLYLRLTASPHTCWMASCSLLHMIEASGLHLEPSSKPTLIRLPRNIDANLRRRLVGFAQYTNMWVSFDLGRTRVMLHGASYTAPTSREGDFTAEMLGLLPLSESLEPHRSLDCTQLTTMLSSLLEDVQTQKPPVILSQCNITLCVFRRLRALHASVCGELMGKMITLTTRALACAREMAYANCPWGHVANAPFQVLCTMLAIDSPESLSRLHDAIQTLKVVTDIYDTDVMREACRTGGLLIKLQQKRMEHDAKTLGGLIDVHFAAPVESDIGVETHLQHSESSYLDNLVTDVPNGFENFDFDQFFIANNPWDMFDIAA